MRTEKPVDPEFILWENIGISKRSKKYRRYLSIIVGFIIAAISLTIVLKFKEFLSKHKELSEFECLQNKIRVDHEETDKLNCKCLKQVKDQGEMMSLIKWTQFGSKNKDCMGWFF